MGRLFMLFILLIAVTLTGCGDTPSKTAITGVIAHTHPMNLPDGTLVTVELVDTTKAGSPGRRIAEQVIKSQGDELPLPFAVVYDPGKINPEHTYSLRVKIEDSDGNLLYTNDTSVSVITQGNLTKNVEVLVTIPNG